MVKRYAEEAGSELVRGPYVVSALARVEVPAALWRKHRTGALSAVDAGLLTADFEDDWYDESGPYAVVAARTEVLELAAKVAGTRGLRAYDSVQLASALVARTADPSLARFFCFDSELRDAAAAEGFALEP